MIVMIISLAISYVSFLFNTKQLLEVILVLKQCWLMTDCQQGSVTWILGQFNWKYSEISILEFVFEKLYIWEYNGNLVSPNSQ